MFDVIAAVCFLAGGYLVASLETVFKTGDWTAASISRASLGAVLGVAGAVLLFA